VITKREPTGHGKNLRIAQLLRPFSEVVQVDTRHARARPFEYELRFVVTIDAESGEDKGVWRGGHGVLTPATSAGAPARLL
jgi:hypothetical protein